MSIFWRLFPAVRGRERTRFLFFGSLFGIVQLAQTLGLAGSEALFLSRVGIGHLPVTFIAASALTVLGSLAYATGVDDKRNDTYFVQMLLGAAVVLVLGSFAAARWDWVLFVLFCLYYLTYAVFQNHYWTFTGDYFDTLTAKRLFPLFTVGASVGGFIGGILATAVSRFAGPEALIAGWGVALAAAAALLLVGKRQLRRWGPLTLQESDETSWEGMRGAVRYMRRSSLSRWLLVSAASMVLALFVSQYLYSAILVKAFPTADSLAAFLGIYLTVTNLLEVVIEVAIAPGLIQRVGVASANLVHPVLTLVAFAGLGISPGLNAALGARVNRELLENALAGPVRNLVYNALPARFRGRVRAFLEGIVVYSGMTLAGVVLMLSAGLLSPLQLSIIGTMMAILYLLANLQVRQEYLVTLVAELKAGRLDLDEVGDEIGKWEAARLAELWQGFLQEDAERPSSAAVQLAPKLARQGITDPLVGAAGHPSPVMRRAILEALRQAPRASRLVDPMIAGLQDPVPEVRLAAVDGLAALVPDLRRQDRTDAQIQRLRAALKPLAEDPSPPVRARAALLLGASGRGVLEAMVRSQDRAEVLAGLAILERDQSALALERVRDEVPDIRAAALERLSLLERPVPLEMAEVALDLRHQEPRVRRAAVKALGSYGDPHARAMIASALGDPSRDVRRQASDELGASGEDGMNAAEAYLYADAASTVEAALSAVGRSGSNRSREILTGALQERVRESWKDLLALHVLPLEGDVPLQFLRAALHDAANRSRILAFRILELLEDSSVMRSVEKVLRFESARSRADALEILSNLGDREAASLLVLMLEEGPLEDKISTVARFVPPPPGPDTVLEEARISGDRWIRMAVAGGSAITGEGLSREEKMERLLILRRVPLFAHMTLEQLEAINQIIKEVQYLAGEVIFREGDVGSELFLLVEGEVRILKNYGTPQELLLSSLQGVSYFGEMAILDDEPRSASVVVSKDARLLSLEGERLKELIFQMPEIAFEIFRVLTQRVRVSDQRLQKMMKSPPSSEQEAVPGGTAR